MWDVGTTGVGLSGYRGGIDGGIPLVLLDEASGTAAHPRTLVLSPLGDYQVAYFVRSAHLNGDFAAGYTSKLDGIPAGHSHATILQVRLATDCLPRISDIISLDHSVCVTTSLVSLICRWSSYVCTCRRDTVCRPLCTTGAVGC